MTIKLTERDKILLYILVLVLMVVGVGYFLILPELDEAAQLRTQAQYLQQDYDALLLQQARIPTLEAQVGEAEAAIDGLEEPLYDAMTNAQVDSLLTGLLLSHGLEPRQMDITRSREALTEPYVFSGLPEANEKADAPLTLTTFCVSGSAIGTQEQWLDFLDTLSEACPAIRVCGFSLSAAQQLEEDVLVSVTELSYTLELYASSEMEAPEA